MICLPLKCRQEKVKFPGDRCSIRACTGDSDEATINATGADIHKHVKVHKKTTEASNEMVTQAQYALGPDTVPL